MLKSNFFLRIILTCHSLEEIDRVTAPFREILASYTTFKEDIMKKYTILALAVLLVASMLAGCRNPNMDMDSDMNHGNTSTPTGSSTDTTTEATMPQTTEPATQHQTSEPTTLPQTDPTTEDSTLGTEETGSGAGAEGRSHRRMPGM